VNFTYDWVLARSIAVAPDPDGALARRYGVTAVPTTFLVDRRGVVRRRWDGFAAAAQLDFAIRPLLGRPLVGGGTTTTSG
jgi:peroxiredoxin